jgi:hypothetical protein
MTTALERALPELAFDDVITTIQQLAENVKKELSERITAITEGDRTISYNRIDLRQLTTLCSATIRVTTKERGEEIKAEAAKKLEKYAQVYDNNANLLSVTEETIKYITSATSFFAETMKNNQDTLHANRKTKVEKDKAKEKVEVCKEMLAFLQENNATANALRSTINHNRNGRKGESYHFTTAKGVLEPAKTWGSIISNGLGYFWNRGESKSADTPAAVEGGGSATESVASTTVVKQPEATTPAPAPASPASPKKETFKDALQHPTTQKVGRVRDPNKAVVERKAS